MTFNFEIFSQRLDHKYYQRRK